MTARRGYTVRTAQTDADLEAWTTVRRVVVPDESPTTMARLRAEESPVRLMVLAELDGEVVGSGVADRSHITGAFMAPRILPGYRRRGAGMAVFDVLLEFLVAHGFQSVGAHVVDAGSLAFAHARGFREVDRQVEQVLALRSTGPEPPPYPGIEFTTVAARPELLEAAFPLATQGYDDMVFATGKAIVPIAEWLRDEASLPAGSIVAIADDRIVGYAGLLAWNGDDTRAENGLTVVERAWRRRGLATALKRRQIAWAAANRIGEIVTWTQTGNEAMQEANHRLGYVTHSTSHTMRRDLP